MGGRVSQVFGLDIEPLEDLGQPLAVALVVKGLDDAGKVSYWVTCGGGLMNVEIIGMMRWGMEVALRGDDDDA